MGLETPIWIADLNPSNPGATDLVSQGDDHIRNLKTALQNTFPFASRPFPIPSSVAKSAAYQVTSQDQNKVIMAAPSGGSVTLTLPALTATDYGWRVEVVKNTTDTNPVIIKPASGTLISGQQTLSSTRRSIPYVKFECLWAEGVWVISRSTPLPIATLIDNGFSLKPTGWEYADGTTLSNSALYPDYYLASGSQLQLPDLQGRATFGRTDMDGSDNGLLPGIGTTLRGTAGTSSTAISQANLPNFNLSLTSLNCAGTVTITDPGHTHVQDTHAALGGPSGGGGCVNDTGLTGANLTGNSQTGITAAFSAGTVAGTLPSGGSGTAYVTLPPLYIVNKLILVE
jgi:hypothetical protein